MIYTKGRVIVEGPDFTASDRILYCREYWPLICIVNYIFSSIIEVVLCDGGCLVGWVQVKVEKKIKMCQSLQIDDIISKLKTEELILGLLKADQERNVWIMLKEMTQSKQVAARQLQTEPGLTLGYQNNGGHIYFAFRLLPLM